MKFAVQYNLMNETQLHQSAEAVKPYPHVFVGVVPFSRDITANEPLEGTDYIPYGSTLMTTIASDLGWKGLHFDLSKMNYRTFMLNHPDMLNDNVMKCSDAIAFLQTLDPSTKIFTRPSEDLKQYSGQVIEAEELWKWLLSMNEAVGGGSYYMSPGADIVVCAPREISAEWRWFIVGGKIVDGSMYRAHGQLRKIHETDKEVIREAQELADKWLPDQCVVMDTALVGDDIRVIEFNCINASGFYDNDVSKIFKALWEYHQ